MTKNTPLRKIVKNEKKIELDRQERQTSQFNGLSHDQCREKIQQDIQDFLNKGKAIQQVKRGDSVYARTGNVKGPGYTGVHNDALPSEGTNGAITFNTDPDL